MSRVNSSSEANVEITSFGRKTHPSPAPMYLYDVSEFRDPGCEFSKTRVDGRSVECRKWISADPRLTVLIKELKLLASVHLDSMKSTYISVGFLDHHGRWAAPCVAEAIADAMSEAGYKIHVRHWELEKGT